MLIVVVMGVGLACSYSGNFLPKQENEAKEVPQAAPRETATPTLYPTPLVQQNGTVPNPVKRVSITDGDRAFFDGDWEQALKAYTIALESSPDSEVQSAALMGIGKTRFMMGKYKGVLNALRKIIDDYPDSSFKADAYFQLARTYETLSRYQEAADAFAAYLSIRPGVIDSYVREWRADDLIHSGNYAEAITDYQNAISTPRLGDVYAIQIKIGKAYAALGEYDTALITYNDVLSHTTNDYLKAQADYLKGQAYQAAGNTKLAHLSYIDAVEKYPLAYSAYLSLVELVDADYPVSELDRGLIDYFVKQYNLAVAAFDRYLNSVAKNADTALYYKGLSLQATGDYSGAIKAWDQLISDYPDSSYLDRAVDEEAYAYWAGLNQYEKATAVLLDFVKENPWHNRAAEFLFMAARIQERGKKLHKAIAIWERIAPEYPHSNYAMTSIFQAGLMYFRLGKYQQALDSFRRFTENVVNKGDEAKGYFWSAKCYRALGDKNAEKSAYQKAANLDPTGYYSERARDILLGRPPFDPPAVYDLGYDLQQERQEAEIWLRTTFGLDVSVVLDSPAELAADKRFIRGTELWKLGEYDLARLEFEDLRKSVASDAVNSFRLAGYLSQLGLHRSAIFAARQVLTLAGMSDAETMNAPVYFNHLRFGTYYQELIVPLAKAYDFHPLFLFSVVRQESLFEGFVFSSAGARGLMQIVPSTGAAIASRNGWPENYTDDDLNRPKVNLTFGTDYLDSQRDYFDGDLYAALAAYNAGPGNAAIWKALSGGDQDLFLETIRYKETRKYIRGIYEIFSIYRRLYNRTP